MKTALSYLRDAGLIIPVYHSSSNGFPLGAEVNSKFVKYLMIDNGLMLYFLGMGDTVQEREKMILTETAENLVDRDNVAEIFPSALLAQAEEWK